MSKLTRWHPFAPLLPLTNPLMRDLFDAPASNGARTWSPRVDVRETEDAYLLQVEIPGLDPSQIEITLKDKTLTLKGEKTREETSEDDTLHLVERTYGSFQRVFTFPEPVDAGGVKAESKHGLLLITVDKAAEAQPLRIEIQPGE